MAYNGLTISCDSHIVEVPEIFDGLRGASATRRPASSTTRRARCSTSQRQDLHGQHRSLRYRRPLRQRPRDAGDDRARATRACARHPRPDGAHRRPEPGRRRRRGAPAQRPARHQHDPQRRDRRRDLQELQRLGRTTTPRRRPSGSSRQLRRHCTTSTWPSRSCTARRRWATSAPTSPACRRRTGPTSDPEYYDPFWKVAQELRDAARHALHCTSTQPNHGLPDWHGHGTSYGLASFAMASASSSTSSAAASAARFPSLKFVITEWETGWIAHFLQRMDWAFYAHYRTNPAGADGERSATTGTRTSSPPSRTTASAWPRATTIGVENLMWGSDFPHHDSTFPRSPGVLDDIFEDIPDDERYLITAGNVRNDLPPAHRVGGVTPHQLLGALRVPRLSFLVTTPTSVKNHP